MAVRQLILIYIYLQVGHIKEYEHHCFKVRRSLAESSTRLLRMSTYIDAAGSFGLQRLPHLAVQYKNEPERKDLFKISPVFKKVGSSIAS
jgi:hypothetical protein